MKALKVTIAIFAGLVIGMWLVIICQIFAAYLLDHGLFVPATGVAIAGYITGPFCAYWTAVCTYRLLP